MTNKEKVLIKEIVIKLKEEYFHGGWDEETKKKSEEKIKEFCKKVNVSHVEGKNNKTVYYYKGDITFAPVKDGESSIQMNIAPTPQMMKLIISMCLENILELCNKQMQAFKKKFEQFITSNEEDLVKESNRIEESFLTKIKNRLT